MIGGFLNHQQYQPIFSHKTSCQAARRCGCRCVGLDIDGPPESQRTSGQRHLLWKFGEDSSRCIRCIELARARAAEAGVGHLCSWLRCDMLQLPEAKLNLIVFEAGLRVETCKTETRPVINHLKSVVSFYLSLKMSRNYEECSIFCKLGATNTVVYDFLLSIRSQHPDRFSREKRSEACCFLPLEENDMWIF